MICICVNNTWVCSAAVFGYELKSKDMHRNYLTADERQRIAHF